MTTAVRPPADEARTSVTAAIAAPAVRPLESMPVASPGYASLERIFADQPIETEILEPPRSGLKLAILSLAGGVGKTTLSVTLARILSGMQRQVLVADCGLYPNVAHHFGSRGQRLGPLQFFYAPAGAAPTLPIGMFRLSLDELHKKDFQHLLAQVEATESLLLMDLPTMQTSSAAEVLAYSDHVLVPVTPDVHSIGSLAQLKQVLSGMASAGYHPRVHYLMNRFDESRRLHCEIHERLRQQLGAGLLPFVIHEDASIEEAAAEGMTVVDHSPGSPAVQELTAVADWLRGLSGSDNANGKEGAC